jgi:hypothetical protein
MRERLYRWSVLSDEESCWLWVGFTHPGGYGHLTISGKLHKAHRLSYEVHKSAIPDGMHVCHTCDNPSCINPDHLFLGTHDDNMKDKARKNRTAPMQGTLNPQSRLSDWMVADIIRRRRSGESGVSVAARFGISPCTVSAIVTGRNWKHMEQPTDVE